MDLIKIIRSVEELVVEIILWIVLLPKTLFRVVVSPAMMAEYFAGEWAKEPSQRFNEYVSPVLFWILSAPVPAFLWLTKYPGSVLVVLGGSSTEGKLLSAALIFLTGPLGYSLQMQKEYDVEMTRENLSKFFALQCYYFGVTALVMNCSLIFVYHQILAMTAMLVSILWFVCAEYVVARKDSQIRSAARFVLLGSIKSVILFVLIIILIELVDRYS